MHIGNSLGIAKWLQARVVSDQWQSENGHAALFILTRYWPDECRSRGETDHCSCLTSASVVPSFSLVATTTVFGHFLKTRTCIYSRHLLADNEATPSHQHNELIIHSVFGVGKQGWAIVELAPLKRVYTANEVVKNTALSTRNVGA